MAVKRNRKKEKERRKERRKAAVFVRVAWDKFGDWSNIQVRDSHAIIKCWPEFTL